MPALHRAVSPASLPKRLAAVAVVSALGLSSFAAAGASPAAKVVTATCASIAAGSHGPAVAVLQRAVGAGADGDFGPMTRAAVQSWQGKHHLRATGVVDAATWKALPAPAARAACAAQTHGSGVAATCATLTVNSVGPAVAVLQAAVRRAGPIVSVDGEFGPQTRAGVLAVQRARKLPATGIVDAATWAALGLTGTPACVSVPAPVKPVVAPVTKPGSGTKPTTPPPPPDAAAQTKIRAQVVALAAALPATSGATADPVARQAIAFALAQRGKPYRWGGAGPSAYDCSGLVMAAYAAAGITTPRVAADQYGAGVAVPLDRAQAGDLLFYASDVAKPATVYHVVIYLGAGSIIDAPYTGAFVGTRKLWTRDLLPVAWRPAASLRLPIRPGTTGWSVAQLQQALDRHGDHLVVDGGYGPATLAAVKAWQQAHKRTADGVVDLATWLTLG